MDGDTYTDADAAIILEGIARKLETDHYTQEEAAYRLAELLRELNGTTGYEGRVKSQGRVSFGRPNEGLHGIAVFVRDWPTDS